MISKLTVPEADENLKPRITVIGVGGAGGNAVNNMIQSNLEGVEFLVANTDSQALTGSHCERRLQLGRNITKGLGAGARPDIGRAAAEEALDDIIGELEGANMVFITAGMGGGTGTGAAPVIARAARDMGLLTVGVITKPFQFEGVHRMRLAEGGISELSEFVDTLIIIPNQNLFRIANEKTTFAAAFKMADEVLEQGVRGVTDLMVMPGLINLDFADIRSVMTEMGKAMMGTGEADGDNRAIAAAEAAISNPLLEDVSMRGARGVIINITGGDDLTLFEVDEAANRIRDEVDPDANIIFGSTFNEALNGRMRVSVVATGIDADSALAGRPQTTLSLVSSRGTASAGGAKPAPAAGATATSMSQLSQMEKGEAETAAIENEQLEAPGTPASGATEATQEADAAQEAQASSDEEARDPESELDEDAFIAPLPQMPEEVPVARADDRNPDAFRAADYANASRERRAEEPREERVAGKQGGLFSKVSERVAKHFPSARHGAVKEPSLFREPPRITEQAPARRTVASAPERRGDARSEETRPVQPAAPVRKLSPAPESATARSAPAKPVTAPATEMPARQTARAAAPEPAKQEDYDMDKLAIPSFLRRQAN